MPQSSSAKTPTSTLGSTHKPALWDEIQQVIANVDATQFKTKISKEKTMRGKKLYAPEVWGKGEWEAKTMQDARQMASDFAEGVS